MCVRVRACVVVVVVGLKGCYFTDANITLKIDCNKTNTLFK